MAVIEGRTWLERLSPAECWGLLARQPVGRIGVLVDSAPEIYPVNYVVDDHTIVFRTDVGSKLSGLDRSPSVSFEVDSFDVGSSTGWSVLVKGRATELSSTIELRRAAALDLRYWAVGDKPRWVRITPRDVTGRRIHPVEPKIR